MGKITNEKLIEVIDFYNETPGATQLSATKQVGISKKGFLLNVTRLYELAKNDPDLSLKLKKYDETKEERLNAGKIKGGTVGIRGKAYKPEDAINIATKLVTKDLSLNETSIVVGIPKTTIHEMVRKIDPTSELGKQVDIVLNSHLKVKKPFNSNVYLSYEQSVPAEKAEFRSTRK